MTEPRHPLDGNMIAADRHYAERTDSPEPCEFCDGYGCDQCAMALDCEPIDDCPPDAERDEE